jgi:hypothetical protein
MNYVAGLFILVCTTAQISKSPQVEAMISGCVSREHEVGSGIAHGDVEKDLDESPGIMSVSILQ